MTAPPPPAPPAGDPPPGRAYFQLAGGKGDKIAVDFNPASLRITLSNQFGEDPPEQHARATSAKLDVELVFDTTETGDDVRQKTQKLHDLTIATATAKQQSTGGKSGGGAQKEPNCSVSKVSFFWGTSSYTGIIETLTETLDYWSSDGVPLRASLQIAMKGAGGEHATYASGAQRYKKPDPAPAPPQSTAVTAPPDGAGATGAASEAGDPDAGRYLAASNGLENMRAPAGAELDASASINLSAAASFQVSGGVSAGIGISAGVSIGFGAGASIGASAAAGLSASVGIGMSAGAGFGASAGAAFGASAGAGFGASAGAAFGASAGAGFGASAAAGFRAAAGASIGASAVANAAMVARSPAGGTASVTIVAVDSGRASAGVAASAGAFAGLGASKTVLPSAAFDPARLLPPPRPAVGIETRFDETGRIVSADGQVAASWAAGGVTFF
ncbi:MAG: hypothetical protein JO013_10180 [Alphaproteobacteria bacterium]|nr:hypothetical protein [Alphaproteobacteria bacterium]